MFLYFVFVWFGLFLFCFAPARQTDFFVKCSYFVSFNFFAQSRPAEIFFFFFFFFFLAQPGSRKKIKWFNSFCFDFCFALVVLDNILLSLRTLECLCCVRMAREGTPNQKQRGTGLGPLCWKCNICWDSPKWLPSLSSCPCVNGPLFLQLFAEREREREHVLSSPYWEKMRKRQKDRRKKEAERKLEIVSDADEVAAFIAPLLGTPPV